jgi:hypothetical protein
MKIIYSIFILLFSLSSMGQTIHFRCDGKRTNFEFVPKVYIDSMLMPYDCLSKIKPNDIENISVVKTKADCVTMSDGEIYINLKKGAIYNFLNFANFKVKYLPNTQKPISLMVNAVFVNDYTNFSIDENNIAKVEIENPADITSIKNIYPNNTIVNILTKESFNRNSVSQVLLNEEIISK